MLEVTAIDDGAVVEVRLNRPPANALDPALVTHLREVLTAQAAGCRAMVLSGQPGMFTAGLDVPTLLTLSREEIERMWRAFLDLMHTLAASPVPVVCAITGHSPAGGAVLAVFCDYRVMARGPWTIGLNEVAVGLPVPEVVVNACARLTGIARTERLLSTAALLPPEEALAAGLVDELAEPDGVVPAARARATRLAATPPAALRETRRFCRRALLEDFAGLPADLPSRMTEVWFSGETQAAMRALVARLARR